MLGRAVTGYSKKIGSETFQAVVIVSLALLQQEQVFQRISLLVNPPQVPDKVTKVFAVESAVYAFLRQRQQVRLFKILNEIIGRTIHKIQNLTCRFQYRFTVAPGNGSG